jgi:HlyD family secretion protein
MTAEVTILIADVQDAITLPITAVVEKRNGYFAYIKTPTRIEERELKIGLTNDTYIEIKDGVKEGDIVVRNPRAVVAEAREDAVLEERTANRSQFGESKVSSTEGGAGAGRGAQGGQGSRRRDGQRPSPSQIIKQADANSDGKLSKDEAPEQMKAFFDLADTDKDGFITSSELTTSMKAMGGGGDRGGERGGPPRDGDTSVQPANKAAGAAQ